MSVTCEVDVCIVSVTSCEVDVCIVSVTSCEVDVVYCVSDM